MKGTQSITLVLNSVQREVLKQSLDDVMIAKEGSLEVSMKILPSGEQDSPGVSMLVVEMSHFKQTHQQGNGFKEITSQERKVAEVTKPVPSLTSQDIDLDLELWLRDPKQGASYKAALTLRES
ncbi:hypothetical protein MG293_018627 [Ovis ammon polii]|uniref:Uncharacterized protein n=1 Tax=Ovis ammon polii TaxID=230172 RepID=A0AAD4Y0N8_OVIAM|nr:hypothetical protein MG293_018627 [Ovis ammon polii]